MPCLVRAALPHGVPHPNPNPFPTASAPRGSAPSPPALFAPGCKGLCRRCCSTEVLSGHGLQGPGSAPRSAEPTLRGLPALIHQELSPQAFPWVRCRCQELGKWDFGTPVGPKALGTHLSKGYGAGRCRAPWARGVPGDKSHPTPQYLGALYGVGGLGSSDHSQLGARAGVFLLAPTLYSLCRLHLGRKRPRPHQLGVPSGCSPLPHPKRSGVPGLGAGREGSLPPHRAVP